MHTTQEQSQAARKQIQEWRRDLEAYPPGSCREVLLAGLDIAEGRYEEVRDALQGA